MKFQSALFLFSFAAGFLVSHGEELRLKDGSVLQGEKVRDEDSVLVFQTRLLGEIRLAKNEIVKRDTIVSASASGQRKNRLSYVANQSALTAYTYGYALDDAFDLTGTPASAAPFFAVTGGIAGHILFAYPRSFEDAHVISLNYAAYSSIASSYLLSFLMLGSQPRWDGEAEAMRIGSLLTLGAYPVSLWLGYNHGADYVSDPGRIDLERAFAFPFALAGGFLPLVYYGDQFPSEQISSRVIAGEALGFGVGGHLISHLYRSEERIPQGVPDGIWEHTFMGALCGAVGVANAHSENVRVNTALMLGASAAGFGEGLWFFRNSADNEERSFYSGLGMLGGGALGAGVVIMTKLDNAGGVDLVALGALAGYALTYSLLKDQIETTAIHESPFMRRVSVNLLPFPETHRLADNHWETGYRIPGLALRF